MSDEQTAAGKDFDPSEDSWTLRGDNFELQKCAHKVSVGLPPQEVWDGLTEWRAVIVLSPAARHIPQVGDTIRLEHYAEGLSPRLTELPTFHVLSRVMTEGAIEMGLSGTGAPTPRQRQGPLEIGSMDETTRPIGNCTCTAIYTTEGAKQMELRDPDSTEPDPRAVLDYIRSLDAKKGGAGAPKPLQDDSLISARSWEALSAKARELAQFSTSDGTSEVSEDDTKPRGIGWNNITGLVEEVFGNVLRESSVEKAHSKGKYQCDICDDELTRNHFWHPDVTAVACEKDKCRDELKRVVKAAQNGGRNENGHFVGSPDLPDLSHWNWITPNSEHETRPETPDSPSRCSNCIVCGEPMQNMILPEGGWALTCGREDCESKATNTLCEWFSEGIAALQSEASQDETSESAGTCPDCNGTGEYRGLIKVETCETCGGKGKA